MEEYLRLAFTVYWQNVSPSTEIFYLESRRLNTIDDIDYMEREVMQLLQTNENVTPLRVVFVAGTKIVLDEEDIAPLGWKVLLTPSTEA